MWYLLFSEIHNSHDLVDTGSIICAGKVSTGDSVKYFYKNKPFIGVITSMSESYDELNKELNSLGAEARHVVGNRNEAVTASVVLNARRTRKATERFTPDCSNSSCSSVKPAALSAEDKTKKNLDVTNKNRAVEMANASVLKLLKDNDGTDATSMATSGPEAGKVLTSDMYHCSKKRKVEGIRPLAVSPTKEAMKRQIFQLQQQLQAASEKTGGTEFGKSADADNAVSVPAIERAGGSGDDKGVTSHSPHFDLSPPHSPHNNASIHDNEICGESVGDNSLDNSEMQSSCSEQDKSILNVDTDNEAYTYQLLGEGMYMVHLNRDIYCRKKDLQETHRHASNVHQSVRRLIAGVFKPSELLNVTLSGTPYRAGNKGSQSTEVKSLHPVAVQTIVDYSNELAKKKGWKVTKLSKLSHTIGVKLNELKNGVKNKKTTH